MTRILLVDDHAAFRQPLRFFLEREPEFTVAAQAGSLTEARGMLEGIDVAIVDLDLPDGDGAEFVDDLRAANPQVRTLVLTADVDRKAHARAVQAGAAGVLHKTVSISDVVGGVHRLLAGESLLSQNETIELLRLADREREQSKEAQRAISSLTLREREVLQALADGLSDKEIAERLYVGSGTVRNHVVSILRKLNVHSRLQALVFAVRHGAVEID
jgi:DNA-binding NarL/FixJ family response regulator